MPSDTTKADLDALSAQIASLTAEAPEVKSRSRHLWAKVLFTRLAAGCLGAACAFRALCDRHNIWHVGVFLIAPLVVGAASFVALELFNAPRGLSLATSALFALGGFLLVFGLLRYPPTSEAAERRDHALRQCQDLRGQLALCKQRQAEIEDEVNRLRGRHAQLQRQLAELNRIRSREYQCQRLFARNWRGMRGPDLEAYLEEVFTLLGYAVERMGKSGDQGVDLIVTRNQFRIAVQVKGYVNSVGNSAVQEAYTGMRHYDCHACAVVTNSRFTNSAQAIAQSTGCILIGENEFREFVYGQLDLIDLAKAARSAKSSHPNAPA